MRKVLTLVIGFFFFCSWVHAELIDNHDGTVTQVKRDGSRLMWMQDANYAKTSGIDTDGLITQAQAKSWAGNLIFAGHTGWRLPKTFQNTETGKLSNSEMGNLYYLEMKKSFSSGLFVNVQDKWYWTSEDFASDPDSAMVFSFLDIPSTPAEDAGYEATEPKDEKICVWLVRDVPSDEPSPTTSYFAQVADGGGYATAFTIINPTMDTATGTVKLRSDDGKPWSISLADGRTASQFSVSVPPMGSTRLVSTGAGQTTKTGWAALDSYSGLSGVETFDYRSDSALLESIGVLGTRSGQRFVLPIDTSSKGDMGLAIANVGTADVSIRLTLKLENGSTDSSLIDSRLDPLATQKHLSIYLSDIFPVLKSSSFKGSLVIDAGSGNITVLGLAFKENQYSAIPVVPPTTPSSTHKVLIDFESLPSMPWNYILQPVPEGARLSDQFLSSYGILFSSGSPFVSVVSLGTGHASSGVNGIAGSTDTGALVYNDKFPIIISFWDKDHPSDKAITDFVSVRADLSGSNEYSVTLNAFDVDGVLIGSDTKWDFEGPILSVSVPGIHSVQFVGTPYELYPDQGGVALDDLIFNSPIPVSASNP